MALIKINESKKRILLIAIIASLIISVVFLRTYLMLIIISAIMAYLFDPIHKYFIKKGKSPNKSALYTFIISVLVVIIPIILIAVICVFQIGIFTEKIASGDYSVNIGEIGNSFVSFVNSTLASLGIDYVLSVETFAENISAAISTLGKTFFIESLINSLSGLFDFITAAIIYIYVFLAMLKNKEKIIDTIKRLNPLGNEISDLYMNRVGSMTKATVKGQFIIAFMQGLETALVLSFVGFDNLFAFFLVIFSFLSLIPLGAGIITIPMGIIMILTGNIWQGVVVVANHLLIVTNIDNVMRPRLVPKNARLEPALMILAVFSGVALFGFIGIVIGPIIMILLITTLQIFLEVFHSIESINNNKDAKHSGRFANIKKRFGFKKAKNLIK